ncbi:MAG: nicotinate (nicotinamide) nucleotide adenylyltransferase [Lentisphaeria bacterium]|nr:nicotinate (nicotinamide) nucleotide adenylyltransferase [Lentisphaeria bacterium]
MKIAMFGGTFDPFHAGHAALAQYILDKGIVDRVLFVPAPVPPHKTREILPYADRRAMVEAGICGMANAEISDIECEREGKSYSIDTLRALAERYPGDEICLLIGGDSLATLHLWFKAHEIVQEFTILSYPRPESVVSAEILHGNWSVAETEKLLAGYMAEAPVFPVSSTQLRTLLKNGVLPGEDLIPAPVLNEIQKKNHYRN